MRLSRADDASVGKDRSPRRCRLDPFPLFGDLRVCFVDNSAHFREHLPVPVPKFLDPLVDECRGRFRRLFHVQLQALAPNLAVFSVTCKLPRGEPLLPPSQFVLCQRLSEATHAKSLILNGLKVEIYLLISYDLECTFNRAFCD